MVTDSERGYQFLSEDALRGVSFDYALDSKKEIDLKIKEHVKDYEEKILVDSELKKNLDGD